MTPSFTVEEQERMLGENLQKLRIFQNLTQALLAERSGISVSAVRNLEGGSGATLHTLISVVRTLKREDWLQTVAPVPTVHPFASASAGRALRSTMCWRIPVTGAPPAQQTATPRFPSQRPEAISIEKETPLSLSWGAI